MLSYGHPFVEISPAGALLRAGIGVSQSTVIVIDVNGNKNHMVRIPKFNLEDIMPGGELGTGAHPAFIVNGVEKGAIYIGKYLASIHDNHALSLPDQDPNAAINFNNANARCTAKGPGWHLMTNAEWAAVALWCWKNGYLPTGNNNYGRDYQQTAQTGIRQDGLGPGNATGTARTLTGTGPAAWNHNNLATGIADLNGNIWEWNAGLRLNNGEIQIIPDNDAAADGADLSASSTLWKAILESGSLVAPGTTGTLKIEPTGADGNGVLRLVKSVVNTTTDSNNPSSLYYQLTAPGITPPPILKRLGLFPHDTTAGVMSRHGRFYARNNGERMPIRGGSWINGVDAGVFSLYLSLARTGTGTNIGFRPAFVI